MLSLVKNNWQKSSKQYADSDWFWHRSAGCSVLLNAYKKVLAKHGAGNLLDAGAGTLSGKRLCLPYCAEYTSVDKTKSHPDLDTVGDVQDLPFSNEEFDTVVSWQVLEHVADPNMAAAEMARVLKSGGKAIVSIPFFNFLHNEPDDYFRYSKHGLRVLLERAGLKVLSIDPLGGLLTFFHHIIFTALVGLTHGLPLLQQITMWLAKLTGEFAIWLDGIIDSRRLFPMYYLVVAEKK